MAKMTVTIPTEVQEILDKYPKIQWERIVRDTLWDYARKVQLMNKIAKKSEMTKDDVEAIDKVIKSDLLKRYQT